MTLADKILSEFNTGDVMADSAISGKNYEVKELPLYLIDPHPENRQLSEKVIKDLTRSIKRDGLGQPILVRESGNGRYQLIAGEHRVEAYKLLHSWTNEDKYETITAFVRHNCDDETARHLLWATNYHSAGLSKVEQGRAFEALGYTVEQLREEYPEDFRGVRTNAIIAELASEGGSPVSESTVYRARKAYKDSQEQEVESGGEFEESSVQLSVSGEAAIDALVKAMDKVEVAIGEGSVRPTWLRPYVKRLRAMSNVKK